MRIDTTTHHDLFGPIPGAQLPLFGAVETPPQLATLAPADPMPQQSAIVQPATRKPLSPLLAQRREERLKYSDSIGPALDRYNAERKARHAEARKHFDLARTIAARGKDGQS